MMIKANATIMTLDEVARALRVKRPVAWRLAKAGRIPSFRVGKAYRILRDDLETYMRNGSRASARRKSK